MARLLPVLALLLSFGACFVLVWVFVPALSSTLWLLSVVGSEWSLHVGLLGLTGALLGGWARRRGFSRSGLVAIGAGIVSSAMALYPPLSMLPVAEGQEASLSLTRYFLGTPEGPPPSVQSLPYRPFDGVPLQGDLYLPAAPPPATGFPAVVVVHGGSWKRGTRSDFPRWNTWLTAHGYAVFDIDYRLAPQPNWQTATDDVQAAVRWLRTQAAAYDLDPARLALLGRSAGGHLALLAAYTADSAATVQAVVGFYAPTDLRWGYENPANPRVIDGPQTLRDFTGTTPTDGPVLYAAASPTHHCRPAVPPTLLFHGDRDQLVRPGHATRLHACLSALPQATDHPLVLLPYAQHGYDYAFDGWGSQVTRTVLLRFLEDRLGRQSP